MEPTTEELRSRYNPDGSELRQLQLKMFEILKVVTDVCDRYKLPYWLSGGTLLGAVRHGGFIPWDDDIDMEMMYKDYKKLMKILPTELPENLYLQLPKEKGYAIRIAKVRDRNSIVYMKDEDTTNYPVRGFFVDIVPMEINYMWAKRLLDATYGRSFRRIKRKDFSTFKSKMDYFISLFLYPSSILLVHLFRFLASFTKPKSIVHPYGVNTDFYLKPETIFPTKKILFEGQEFQVPNDPDTYLRTQYKFDYNKIPPEDKRPQHFIKIEFL